MACVQAVSAVQGEVANTSLRGAIVNPGEAGHSVMELMRSLVIQEDY